ncbi:MAG: GtrA family protein [Burkholderiaceae bacterium]|nr:GtrA family protein [Burkholderiaceae bacterium]
MRKKIGSQFLRFGLVGAFGTLCHYALLYALVSVFDFAPGLSAGAGAALGAAVNYTLNRRFTFASKRSHREAIPRFLILAATGVLLNGVIVGQLSLMGTHYMIAQFVATILILVINFSASRIWVFQPPR